MLFNDLVRTANSRVMTAVGEPVRITKADTGRRSDPVMVVIDRGVEVYLGEVASVGTTVSYREEVTGQLVEGDIIDTDCGEQFVLNRRLEGDGDMITRLVVEA